MIGAPMDPNGLLLWMVLLAAGLTLARGARAGSPRGWMVVGAAILGVTLAALALEPGIAGFLGGGLWAVLVLLPALGSKLCAHFSLRQEYGKARAVAHILRILHPADGWREQPELLRALELAQRGAVDEAAKIFERHQASETALGRVAAMHLFRLTGRWPELLAWIDGKLAPRERERDVNVILMRLRALGETGDLGGLLDGYERSEPRLEAAGQPHVLHLCRLFVFAFSGRADLVRGLMGGALAGLPETARRFWTATADMAAGRLAEGRAELEAIRAGADPIARQGIERRLAHPLAEPAGALAERSGAILAAAERRVAEEERWGRGPGIARRRAFATIAIVAANLAVFAVEVAQGGSTSLATLYRLGALAPPAVLAGEWWRVFAALFLHFGALHLLMNMVGLLALGPFVERSLGVVRFLAAYFVAGLGSMLAVVALARAGSLPEDQILVGASGSIMGLVGASAAVLLVGYWRERARLPGSGSCGSSSSSRSRSRST